MKDPRSKGQTSGGQGPNGKKSGGAGPYPLYRGPNFNISIPQEWKDRAAYMFVGPESGAYAPTVTILCDRETRYESAKDFADKEINTLETAFYGYRLLFRREIPLRKGLVAHEVLVRWEGGGEKRLFQRKLFALADKTAYTVTAIFVDETGEGRNSVAESILASFNPLPVEDQSKNND